MKKSINFKKLLPHLLVVVGFIALSVGYMSPVLKGKILTQGDPVRAAAGGHEAALFQQETGQWTGWTNGMFGGMPTYLVHGGYTRGVLPVVTDYLNHFLGGLPNMIFYYLIAAYILLLALDCGLWVSLLGAIAYAFFSYNIVIIEAGHISKVYALGFAPLMFAGMVLAYKNRPWLGAALFSIGLGLDFNTSHFQITYYTGLLLIIFAVFEFVRAIKTKSIGSFALASVLAVVMGGLAVATISSRMWSTYEYQKETIRGKSELTLGKKEAPADGLDRGYAFEWSYGKLESLTLLIPNFSGGASGGGLLTEKSEAYKAIVRYNVPDDQALGFAQNLPTYWGDQMFVQGSVYAGAIVCFLFILGLFIGDNRYKIPFAITALLCLIICWGKNMGPINNLLFDYLPMFNKFRSVSMIMSLLQLSMVIVGGLALKKILEKPDWATFKQPFFISLGIVGGLTLILALVPSIVGLRSDNDPALIEQLTQAFGNNKLAANDLYSSLIDDRGSLLRSDALRSLFFILAAAVLIWAFVAQKIKNSNIVMGILALLVLVDLWSVDKRYLNDAAFKPKYYSTDELFQPTAANLQIMEDKDPNYRVIDVTTSPLSDATASYFHKSLGGYHAAKLRRYQELFENQMAKNNMAVYNMLNTKYFITADDKNQPIAQRNADAMGNAWFVAEVKMVKNADEEIKALDKFDPLQVAFVDVRFTEQIKATKMMIDSANKIKLIDYKPNNLIYQSNTKTPQIAVFSEIYYRGGIDWKAYIDGVEAPHFRANYVLRAMNVPAGSHKIEFKFQPDSVIVGQKIDNYASIAWLMLIGLAFFMDTKRKI